MRTQQFLFSKFLICGLIGGLLSGCLKRDIYDPNYKSNQEVFDFATKASYTLNVKYDVTEGRNIYFEVYPETPISAEGVKKSGLEAIDKGYTDEKGTYSNPLRMPSSLKKVYIYTPCFGVPRILEAEVVNGTLQPAALPARSKTQAKEGIGTRAIGNVSDYKFDNITTKLLGSWIFSDGGYSNVPNAGVWEDKARLWGRPNYLTYVSHASFPGVGEAALVLPAAVENTIDLALPGDGNGPVAEKILENGDIHVSEETELSLYFLDEQCLYMNALAYYCYPTNNPPKNPSDIKVQTIAFPNAKRIADHGTYFPGTSIRDYGSLLKGEGIQLHYFDQNGVDKGKVFPAGVSIGWIMYADGFNVKGAIGYSGGEVSVGKGARYSNKALNGGTPYSTVFRHQDFVITSFEDSDINNGDWSKSDFKDLIFHVGSSVSGGITPGVPDVDPEPEKPVSVVSRGILTFEDQWPFQGDFDMNDVVVRYVSTVLYNKNNEVIETIDKFTILGSGANFNNDFAYENKNITLGNAEVTIETSCEEKPTVDKTANIVRLANKVLGYANKDEKTTFIVRTKYNTPIAKASYIPAPYNPFIAVMGNTAREVHLSNYTPTSYANPELLGTGNDLSNPLAGEYYITYHKSGYQMPFGIDIVFMNDTDMSNFVIPKETYNIANYYPTFLNWVHTGGKEDSDWYLKPKN